VQRCVERVLRHGGLAALDDGPRPGREPRITEEVRAWLVGLACRKAKDLGDPHELWTQRLLARLARTPKHGSWLNLIEGFFSRLARSVLRHIRVASKQELKDRILAAIDDINRHPVVHTWCYKLNEAA
jgi:hypothetical protein